MHGGVNVYRGNAAAARSYVEADYARVDDYYLAEGTGLAERFVATPDGVTSVGMLDGDGYEAWVAGRDPDTGIPRGRLRQDPAAVRFVEVTVNGPKTWSLAAALHPEIAAAYDAAQDRAARQVIGWLAEDATTRVGPRGRQVQVPVEALEAVTVRHYTSRAGDPHRHLHLQVNARVFAAGTWRGLHTVGVRDSIDAVNGIGHAAVATDLVFRTALAVHGFTLDPESGEVVELAPFAGAFSARARQITANLDRYETAWRAEHPGTEPGPELRRAWDRRAWADARPDKIHPQPGGDLTGRWVTELHRLGYQPPQRTRLPVAGVKTGQVDRDAAVATVVSRLGARRSAWNAADIRGEVEQLIARSNIVAAVAVRLELAEDLTARCLTTCLPLLPEDAGTPEHVRALTSPVVLQVEEDLTAQLAARGSASGTPLRVSGTAGLGPEQVEAVGVLAGSHRPVVVEGAAGTGKTATLAATRRVLASFGERMVVVTPTLKAAQVATNQTGSAAFSAAWLIHQHGYRWDSDGHWMRRPSQPRSEAVLRPGDLLLVDEAGMVDQDTATALLTIAEEAGARVALVGDRHQLPAVGRGGVLDHATACVHPDGYRLLGGVHRFTDPDYAHLSLAMRTGEDPAGVFDQLWARGQIQLYPDELTRTSSLAAEAAESGALVVADTRDQVAALNHAIRTHRIHHGTVDDQQVVITHAGERLGVGDRVATRRNDPTLGVANRQVWTITRIDPHHGQLTLAKAAGAPVMVPAGYAKQFLELAYATTIHGAQGDTVTTAHLSLGDHTGAASAYVAMTRGREANTAHLIAEDPADARRQWVETFARDRADLGPRNGANLAAADTTRYGTQQKRPRPVSEVDESWHTPARHQQRSRRDHERDHPRPPAPSPRGPGIGF